SDKQVKEQVTCPKAILPSPPFSASLPGLTRNSPYFPMPLSANQWQEGIGILYLEAHLPHRGRRGERPARGRITSWDTIVRTCPPCTGKPSATSGFMPSAITSTPGCSRR